MVSAQDDYNPENPSEPGAVDYCRVIVSANYPEGADVSGGGRYIVNGNSIYISTNARNDANYTYNFQYWTLNGERTSYSQYFSFTPIKGRFEFVAHYEKIDTPFEPENPSEPSTSNIKRKYYLYLTSNIEGACSFSMASGNKVEENSLQWVTVYPNVDYKFDGWKLNGQIVSTERTYSFTMPSAHTTLEACLTEIPFDPSNPSEPSSDGSNVDNTTRKLVNLAIGTAKSVVDKTRIVINEAMTLGYDTGTDATKFLSDDADYQIYSLDADNVKYSVNERPNGDGIIPLGVVIKKAGSVVISATRLDCSAYLYDKVTECLYDLSTKAYMFNGEVGTFEDRFYVKVGSLGDISFVKVDDKTREYGEENPQLTYTVEGASLSGEPSLSTTADKQSPVGTYPIVVSKGSVQGDLGVTNGTLTIKKAPLTISGGTYTIKQGEALPEFKASYEGWKNNETEAVLTTGPTLTTTATSKSKPGTYDVVVSGAEAQNYAISYVVGKLTVAPGVYKLIYKVGDEVYKSYDVEYGSTITPETEPAKEGYTFSGWSTIPKTMPAKDVTIIGTFSINKYKLTYKVDGEVYKTFDVEFGTAITPEIEPTKEGYSFSGWSTIPETMPAHDVTVTGSFSKGQYKLIYVVDEQTYKTISYDFGDAITPEPAPEKDGYSFSGWSEIPETMPAKDVTVTGTFTINKYKLTYQVDGEVYKTIDVEYGASITPETEPTKEGYTFSGWSNIPATMPAKDVTVSGTFSINKYKLTYEVDGKVYKTYDVEYGATITPEEEPTKEGYTFSGWSEIPAKMPAKDVTITGSFSVNKYKLTYMVDGEVYKTYDVEYGATITPEEEPTKEGHTFSGWSEIPETMPAHDVTVSGTFTLESGIDQIMGNENGSAMIFTIDGKRVDNLKKGLNVIRMKDGTKRKVVVK